MQTLQLGFVYLNAGLQARILYTTGRSWFSSVLANTVLNCLCLGAYLIENSQQPSYPEQSTNVVSVATIDYYRLSFVTFHYYQSG
jgi:hypothetical protein